MLERILEPEVMDEPDEAADYDAMDHSQVNRQFVSDLLSATARMENTAGEILDLGTGSALIPIELCRHDPRARVLGVDLAASMLQLGQRNVDAAGLADRILLQLVDAKTLPFPDNRFAAVMSNSIVHHIPRPYAVLSEALRVLARGGMLFFRDLLRPADEATAHVLIETYAAGANANQRRLFEDSLRAALSLNEIQDLAAVLGFPSPSVQQTSDRHWTWRAVKA